jgi:hypothetical protein
LPHSLWHTQSKWISDPHSYVFLPRAVLEIGKALYPNEWTGVEPATPVFLPLPLRSADAPEWQKREAHIALCKERPDFGRKPLDALPHHSHISLGGFSKGPPIIPPFTDAEWEAARAIYRTREDAARPAWVRYTQVCKTVTGLAVKDSSLSDCDPVRAVPFIPASPNGGRLKATHCIIGLSGSERRAPPRSQMG